MIIELKEIHWSLKIFPLPQDRFISCAFQMVWFRENWYEEVLRQLRQGLAKCRAVAFENRANVADTAVTPHTLNFVCKLVSTFGVGVENSVASVVTSTFSSAASESLARRAQATAQDPIFQRMKSQFTADFDFRCVVSHLSRGLLRLVLLTGVSPPPNQRQYSGCYQSVIRSTRCYHPREVGIYSYFYH
jgi:hypothetical protein